MSNNTLCLDYGERYVGVAITDAEGKIALRRATIDQKDKDVWQEVGFLVEQEEVKKVLVGVPVSLSGGETAQTRASLTFLEKLQSVLGDKVAVEGVDEVFSSKEARRRLRAEGGNEGEEHMEAARLMLADYIARGRMARQDI